jgi:hypothetical protein
MDRFTWGYAGWPTSSAWGSGQRLRVYAAEYAAFANFWWDWDERFARQRQKMAMCKKCRCGRVSRRHWRARSLPRKLFAA